MQKIQKWVVFTLLFTLLMTTIQAQDSYDQEDEAAGSAYVQSSQSAHWSVYVPITILVVAAIWFGVSDKDHNDHSKYTDSQDGLGSIDSSKRHSSWRSRDRSSSCRNTYSRSCHCHH